MIHTIYILCVRKETFFCLIKATSPWMLKVFFSLLKVDSNVQFKNTCTVVINKP